MEKYEKEIIPLGEYCFFFGRGMRKVRCVSNHITMQTNQLIEILLHAVKSGPDATISVFFCYHHHRHLLQLLRSLSKPDFEIMHKDIELCF